MSIARAAPLAILLSAVLAAATALLPEALHAAPAEKLLLGAGPLPSDARAKAAILQHLLASERELDRRKPFRVLSGPTLATGNTFGGSIEQAWLVCIVLNTEKMKPGAQPLEGKPVYLRSRGPELAVVPVDNWKDSSPRCQG